MSFFAVISFLAALTLPEQVMFGVVVLLALFAGWRNATAGALVVSYAVVTYAWWRWQLDFPVMIDMIFDASVIVAIYSLKPPAFECFPYTSLGHQFCSMWLERSHWDRLVIVLFGIAWLGYVLPMSDSQRWLVLYWAAMGQYFAAGAETLQASLAVRSAKAETKEPESTKPPGMEFVTVRGGGHG